MMVKRKSSWSQVVKNGRPTNLSIPTRNLPPQDLGAVIFGCTNNTIAECHSRQLFGLPRTHISYVQNIKEGLPLFLFNYDDRKLYGIYEAASNGKFCPESNAWSQDGKGKTSYPAQVAMRVKVWCVPIAESQFRDAIVANYYQKTPGATSQKLHFFQFELDHAQTHALMNMFTPSPSTNNFWMPPVAQPANEHVRLSWAPVYGGNNGFKSDKVVKSYADVVNKKKFEQLETRNVDAEHVSSGNEYLSGFDDLDCGEASPESEEYAVSGQEIEVQQHQHQQQQQSDQQNKLSFKGVLEKLKKLSVQQKNSDFYANATETEGVDAYGCKDVQDVKCAILDVRSTLPENLDSELDQLSWGHSNLLMQSLNSESWTEAKLVGIVKELHERIEVMEKKQAWSNKELKYLQGVNEMLLKRVVELKGTVKTLNSKIDPLTLDDSLNQFVEQCLGSENVIYLVGGFDGFSFLPSLDSFSPSLDILTPLKPMAVGKSYASTVALDGKIFVLGGGDGACWFDTVDCYDRRRDDWTKCPSLSHDKGSLAAVSFNGKIYAFGGGDGNQCFADVEVFDPAYGNWINYQPMLEKRFALAGVELNGAIYAVGGFNGAQYLSSAERLDPREPSWKRLPTLSAGRGCHTLAVLNDKIFSIGGYDAEAKAMVATVELYEPRMPSWVMAEPMNSTRGYHSSAVLGGSIFTFGGVKGEADAILDVVERYREGCGWVNTELKSIGRRCYCSAIVL
uniref:DCD domain-containing protein n=1 Tax=Leersia perrieri TaxID=77586 RepID=A0A0D9WZW9_9ORYZ